MKEALMGDDEFYCFKCEMCVGCVSWPENFIGIIDACALTHTSPTVEYEYPYDTLLCQVWPENIDQL